MTDITIMIPHILRWECSVFAREGESAKALFSRAAKSGVINDPNDRGGATFCGVTLSTYAEWCRKKGYPVPTVSRLAAMDYDTWCGVLTDLFWDRCNADKIRDSSVALMLVDWCWVNGAQAIRDAQTAFSLVADGIVGVKTLAALNAEPALTVFERLRAAREKSYRDIVARRPASKRYLKGWLNRTQSIQFRE